MALILKFFQLAILVFLTSGCIANFGKVDHSINLSNIGKSIIVDVTFSYGDLGLRHIEKLGFGGTYISAPMEVPKLVFVKWTTEENGLSYKAEIPLYNLINAYDVAGGSISIELNDKAIEVYLIKRIAKFRQQRMKLFQQIF